MIVLSNELLVILFALMVAGFTKGLTGLGLPMVSVPVLANFFGVEQAVMIIIIPVLVTNIWLMIGLRDCYPEVPELRRIIFFGIPGASIGAFLLYYSPEKLLASLLAFWILIYLLISIFRSNLILSQGNRNIIAPYVGFFSGILQSSSGISAPVVASYVDAIKISPKAYVFTVATIFTALSGTHFIILIFLQAYSKIVFVEGLWAILPTVIFVALGSKVRKFMSPLIFRRIIKALLVIMAIRLIYNNWFI